MKIEKVTNFLLLIIFCFVYQFLTGVWFSMIGWYRMKSALKKAKTKLHVYGISNQIRSCKKGLFLSIFDYFNLHYSSFHSSSNLEDRVHYKFSNLPIHWFRCISLKPQNKVNIIMCIFWQNVTWQLRSTSEDSLNFSNGHCNE